MRVIAALVCCPALLAVARPAECMQAPPPRLEPGTRIRLEASGVGGRLTGTVEEVSADTLMVRVDGDAPGLAVIVPTNSVTRLDVRRERSMTVEGLGLGVLAGTLLAVLASPDVVDENGNCTTAACLAYKVSPRLDKRIEVLSLAGALLGAIVGSTTRTTTWATVDLQRLNVGPTADGGLAFGVRISF